jgi:hypothetical protein
LGRRGAAQLREARRGDGAAAASGSGGVRAPGSAPGPPTPKAGAAACGAGRAPGRCSCGGASRVRRAAGWGRGLGSRRSCSGARDGRGSGDRCSCSGARCGGRQGGGRGGGRPSRAGAVARRHRGLARGCVGGSGGSHLPPPSPSCFLRLFFCCCRDPGLFSRLLFKVFSCCTGSPPSTSFPVVLAFLFPPVLLAPRTTERFAFLSPLPTRHLRPPLFEKQNPNLTKPLWIRGSET